MRNSRGVFVEGYRAMGYNATFEKTMVEVVDKHKAGRHIIELEDVNSGVRLMVSVEDNNDKATARKSISAKKGIKNVGAKA